MRTNLKYLKLKKMILPILLFIIVALAIPVLYFGSNNPDAPEPANGVLDLTGWNFENGRPSLAGQWEFYWGNLYTHSELQATGISPKQIVYVPKTWDAYELDGKELPGFGYATYKLTVIVRDAEQSLSLRLNNIATAYRLFANDLEIASIGTVGTDRQSTVPGYQSRTITFKPPSKEFSLILQVSNFSYARGGVWYDIGIGTSEQMDTLNRMNIYKDAILIGSLLIMAIHYSSFYSIMRKDRSSRYLILLCMIFIVRISLFGDSITIRLFPKLPFEFLVYLTYVNMYWIPVVLFLMIASLYPQNIPRFANTAVVIYGIGVTLIAAILPMQIYTKFTSVITVIGAMIVCWLILITVRAMRSEKGALLVLVALFGILATIVHDSLYHATIIHNSFGELMSVGIFQLLFVCSFISARRLADAYEQANQLTLHLGEALKKEKEATDELVKTEMAFLKAQIKPHFLYNSLSVITALSTKNPQQTKSLLYDLSDYLRGSFNFENYDGMTPIESELSTVRAYLSIEMVRFQGKLNVEYDIDESITISVPLLTIQPLVENAIRHGIMKRSES